MASVTCCLGLGCICTCTGDCLRCGLLCGHSGCRESPRGVPCTLHYPRLAPQGLGPGSSPRAAGRCGFRPFAFLERGCVVLRHTRHRRCLGGGARHRLRLWGSSRDRHVLLASHAALGAHPGGRGPLHQRPGPLWVAPEHGLGAQGGCARWRLQRPRSLSLWLDFVVSGPQHGTAWAHHGGRGGGFPCLSRGRPPNPNALRTGAGVHPCALCFYLLMIIEHFLCTFFNLKS